MKVHSMVDLVTNSSSTTYTYPHPNFIDGVNSQIQSIFGKNSHIEINLKEKNIDQIIFNYGRFSNTQKEFKNVNKYEFMNDLFKKEKYILADEQDDIENNIEISLVIDSKKINISDLTKKIFNMIGE